MLWVAGSWERPQRKECAAEHQAPAPAEDASVLVNEPASRLAMAGNMLVGCFCGMLAAVRDWNRTQSLQLQARAWHQSSGTSSLWGQGLGGMIHT